MRVPDSRLHSTIQTRINAFTDLVPVELHALWDRNPGHFIEKHLVEGGVIDYPAYWYSPSQRHHIGFWNFSSSQIPRSAAIPETTLFTLLDDVTAELATRIVTQHTSLKNGIGFTVNLSITKTGASPLGRLFFFDAYTTLVAGRKIVVECPLFDAETGAEVMIARGTFVFMPLGTKMKQVAEEVKVDYAVPSPLIHAPDSVDLADTELAGLNKSMSILLCDLTKHKSGSFSEATKRIAAVLDFGADLNGPPIYVHGGVLGTVLYNASVLLFSKISGVSTDTADAVFRDINYRKGVPMECEDVIIDASIESTEGGRTTILAKIMRGEEVFTTLRTVFTNASKAASRGKL
ncbi:hypothetical protein GQ54DRAFT_184669 [Martensiomyces pterosporus]|nr:hypothetical protein GQ54DRAFT_184669 [Martensiomyces pterosporus]